MIRYSTSHDLPQPVQEKAHVSTRQRYPFNLQVLLQGQAAANLAWTPVCTICAPWTFGLLLIKGGVSFWPISPQILKGLKNVEFKPADTLPPCGGPC